MNQSVPVEFILLGFPSIKEWWILFFLLLLCIYLFTIMGNLIIIMLVWSDLHLHTPMYFFLGNFSFMEIWYVTVTTPEMMANMALDMKTISLAACLTQCYFFFSLGTTELLLLAVMAFDRYLAICKPLRYSTIMSNRVCLQLSLSCWLGGFLGMIPSIMLAALLQFCGPYIINHFFCDSPTLMKLSCTDTYLIELINFILALNIIMVSFALTLISYIFIVSTILRIPSTTGRHKAFSTCFSHLTVVLLFYGTATSMYAPPKATNELELNKVVAVFYTFVTPMLNPLIYSFRNKEVKVALKKAISRAYHSER
ncbi:olfactory receptor 6N1-like [Microcaecilia unicolor]|uniref:Olfactory receptor n=1 Tax=Microcaecilia unicolor TaxID=1415580 RepID=A0A6P7WGN8_9AMPH|nr:olfactory receptor 6N1-like [Microcaecilia unicolor]XP_030042417.1 olfactory receptor 6N1-like [Microcaecilia unicolor]